jgi:hypothetical protein
MSVQILGRLPVRRIDSMLHDVPFRGVTVEVAALLALAVPRERMPTRAWSR